MPERLPRKSLEPLLRTSSKPLLRIGGLTKRYGGAVVVNDLSFAIDPGECLGVIGPNGAGKTTTLRMCLGLTGPDTGTIEAFGLPIPAHVRGERPAVPS